MLGPVHTKTIVNANASKPKLFYAFRPPVHMKTMKTLTVNALIRKRSPKWINLKTPSMCLRVVGVNAVSYTHLTLPTKLEV